MWSKVMFELLDCFEEEHFMGVVGRWGKTKQLVTLINVYAPCNLRVKKNLWQELIDLQSSKG